MIYKGVDLEPFDQSRDFHSFSVRWLYALHAKKIQEGIVFLEEASAHAILFFKNKGISIEEFSKIIVSGVPFEHIQAVYEDRWDKPIPMNIRALENYNNEKLCQEDWFKWQRKQLNAFKRAAIQVFFGDVSEDIFHSLQDMWFDMRDYDMEDHMKDLKSRIDDLERVHGLIKMFTHPKECEA